jgi:hypothetical protein
MQDIYFEWIFLYSRVIPDYTSIIKMLDFTAAIMLLPFLEKTNESIYSILIYF